MPRIELIPEVLYGPNDPIHWEVDNLPLQAILTRIDLVNFAVDNILQEMRDAIGTQGSVANRLNQSINADGSLKTSAIDAAEHTMDDHADTANYVRMAKSQSDKLDLVADEATNVSLTVYTSDTNFVVLNSGVVEIQPSSTIIPEVDAPNIVRFNMAFPTSAVHQHYYGLAPVPANLVSPDYLNYQVNSISSAVIIGSLRIYINGVRIFSDAEVYVPGEMVSDPWTLMSFTPDEAAGTFQLTAAITPDDVISIDFDIALA